MLDLRRMRVGDFAAPDDGNLKHFDAHDKNRSSDAAPRESGRSFSSQVSPSASGLSKLSFSNRHAIPLEKKQGATGLSCSPNTFSTHSKTDNSENAAHRLTRI